MRIVTLFWIAFFIWAASEIVIVIRMKLLRHNISATKLDKGSYWLVIIGIYAGIGIAFFFHSQKWGWVSQPVANMSAILMTMGVTFVFLGIVLNSWIASLVILLMLSAVFVYRIHIEEKALISHFHSVYEDYRQNTWRLIPYVW